MLVTWFSWATGLLNTARSRQNCAELPAPTLGFCDAKSRVREFLQGPDLLLQERRNPVFNQVNPGDTDAQGLGDLGGRPALGDAEVKNLEVALIDTPAHALKCLCQQVLFPGSVPFGAEIGD